MISSAQFLWVKSGTVQRAERDDQIDVLLDLGALDLHERIGMENTKVVVLTEDQITRGVESLFKSAGFVGDATVFESYYGVTNPKSLRPLIRFIANHNPNAKVIVHRDRDYLSDDEVTSWQEQMRELGVEPFVTDGVDVESHFISAEHLAILNPTLDQSEFEQLIDEVATEANDELIRKMVNGWVDIARKRGTLGNTDIGDLAIRAPRELAAEPERFRHGKILLKRLRAKFRERTGQNLIDLRTSEKVKHEFLDTVAERIFGV